MVKYQISPKLNSPQVISKKAYEMSNTLIKYKFFFPVRMCVATGKKRGEKADWTTDIINSEARDC